MPAPTATSADVAAIVPERVTDPSGDFTALTNPTQGRVELLVAQIVQEVQAIVGSEIPDALTAYATLVIATGTAALVELGFTNSNARDTESKYEFLRDLYRGDKANEVGGMLAILDASIRAITEGGAEGDAAVGMPWATMPDLNTAGVGERGGYTSWSGSRW